jgi:hypothetical protein
MSVSQAQACLQEAIQTNDLISQSPGIIVKQRGIHLLANDSPLIHPCSLFTQGNRASELIHREETRPSPVFVVEKWGTAPPHA